MKITSRVGVASTESAATDSIIAPCSEADSTLAVLVVSAELKAEKKR
jgi:hypothetical protein